MENVEIARVLNEYADLLDIQHESPFRVRSYRQAARTIEGLSRPVTELLDNGKELRKLPGVGSRMVEHLQEIVDTGTLSTLQDIRKEFPSTLTELVQLEGVGPKRARQLYEELGIKSLPQLEKALDSGEVESLHGFSEKSVKKMRRAIGEFEQHSQRVKLSDADQLIRPFLDYLREVRGTSRLEVAGSYRRRKETIGDVDILATCKKPDRLMKQFQSYPEVARVELAGKTRASVVLQIGLKVDLRVLPPGSYGAALHYFTGSKEHNVAVRKLGVERGLRINEYGVFRVPKRKKVEDADKAKGKRIAGKNEEDVFRAVGMEWVPPELREDRGEVQAALKDKLPKLITGDDIRGDLHMHSKWTDGGNTIEEMAEACRRLGYAYCAITDHSKATRVAGGLNKAQFRKQWREIDKVRKKLDKIVLLSGAEVDILADGSLDLPAQTLKQFDIVVASVHSNLNMDKKQMTKRILKAVANPAVDILAHPTGRQINKREPFAVDLEAVFKAARDNDVAMELNAQPERLDLSDIQVYRARELGVKIVISTDAHSTHSLRFMDYGIDQARRGWLEKKHVLNTMTWRQLQKWLRRR